METKQDKTKQNKTKQNKIYKFSWGGFPIEKCIAKLQFSPDTSYCVRLCKLFSGPSEAYEVLEVRCVTKEVNFS